MDLSSVQINSKSSFVITPRNGLEIIGFDVDVQQEVVHHHWSKLKSIPILGCLHEAVLSKCKQCAIASHSEDLRNLPSI
jgi:hypothetical protein